MRWNDLARGQPTLAALAHAKLVSPGVLLVGTVRKDGSARVSGVEPLVLDGDLYLSMMQRSTKALDLYRDPRITIHSIVTGPEAAGEVKLRGVARVVEDASLHEAYAAVAGVELGWQPVVGDFALFAIEIDSLTYIGYDSATGAQHVALWPANEEYLRETLSPTKLGPKQAVRRLTSA